MGDIIYFYSSTSLALVDKTYRAVCSFILILCSFPDNLKSMNILMLKRTDECLKLHVKCLMSSVFCLSELDEGIADLFS